MTSTTVNALIVDLLAWLSTGEKPYLEVMDAWRTSCPRLTVWEDASDRKLVQTEQIDGNALVRITPAGLDFLKQHRCTREIR
jgi:hypothetical protein